MPNLTEVCTDYLVEHLSRILEANDNIPTYKSHIAKNIARKVTIKTLDVLYDPKDVMLSRLYKKKLELYFEDSDNLLYKCKLCNELYTNQQREIFN